MDYRAKLFAHKHPYDHVFTDSMFLNAVKRNISFHEKNCPIYKSILVHESFDIHQLHTMEDLFRIPVLPTLYLKKQPLFSMDEKQFLINAASSGTSGSRSIVGIDHKSFYYGMQMVYRVFSFHRLLSIVPTNYIILGYKRKKDDPTGTAQTMLGTSMLTPAMHRAYAVKEVCGTLQADAENILKALYSYQKQGLPVRFVGLPAYMFFLVSLLKENGIKLRLNKSSKVLMGGGFKRLALTGLQRQEFDTMINETLGIKRHQCYEFFSAVEHPIAYCACRNGHFHVPIYSRVIIRDIQTMLPVPMGSVGLLSFVTPMLESVPLVSVVTDDIAILHNGASCGCGISSPYFEVLGRAGVQGIKTCAAGALEVLGGAQP